MLSNSFEIVPIDLQSEQNRITRADLDKKVPKSSPIHGQMDIATWYRITSIMRFWEQPGKPSLDAALTDVLTGLHALRADPNGVIIFHLLILGREHEIQIFVGITNQLDLANAEQILVNSFAGSLPGIELHSRSKIPEPIGTAPRLGEKLRADGYLHFIGNLTGIPTRKTGLASNSQHVTNTTQAVSYAEPLDRLIRGMYGTRWGYMVSAMTLADAVLRTRLEETVSLYTRASALLKATGSISETGKATTFKDGVAVQESRQRTFEMTNRQVQLFLEMLDRQINRLETGRAEGMWSTLVFFFAPQPIIAARAGALLRGCFGGNESRPEPIRVALQRPEGTLTLADLSTDLTSSELAILTQLPQQEYSGYRVYDYARFDVDADQFPTGETLSIGEIKDGSQATGNSFHIQLNDLSKHALVVGVTGSGKTTTIFRLLHQLITNSNRPIPFLVIEPAKTEYRRLISHPAFANLRIYTLGNERIAPIRLNPFEFDIVDDKERTHVQTHIDYLKSVFNAAFVLYAPMPYVLDIALHEIYQDKGWNLATGLNERLSGIAKSNQIAERQYPVFPTLSDLRRKVAQVVARLGYEERIKMDVTAGLQARIDSLRLGGKGLMLDVAHGIDMRDLLAQPTVLELDRIGNDEEKAFIIGLLLSRLSAFRQLQGNSALRHVTVVEEAHRLLKNVSTEVGTEEASNKAAAVEGFCNMLSEIRAYGEGIIIAEQIPSKLAPDAIKNTNLKLLHRMLAQDDRDVIGTAINLSEEQSRRAVTLNPQCGEVIAFAEGSDRPYLLQVPLLAGVSATAPKDEAIRKHMDRFLVGPLYEPAPDFDRLVGETDPIQRLHLYLDARDIARSDPLHNALIKYVQALVADPDYAADASVLLQPIRRAYRGLSPAEETKLSVAVAVCATHYFTADVGDLYGSSYPTLGKLRRDLAELLNQAIRGFTPSMSNQQLQLFISRIKPLAVTVANDWMNLTRASFGPLMGCLPCQSKCIYRIAGVELIRISTLTSAVAEAMAAKGRSKNTYWREVAAVFEHWAGTITRNAEAQRGLKLCLAAHYAHMHHTDNTGFQLWFVKNVVQA